MSKLRAKRHDALALCTLFILPLLWFLPVLFPSISGVTLLPYDNLYSFEPWRSMRPDLVPHNNLLSDLILENAVWKQHVRQTLGDGSLGMSGRFPLWNPQIVTGLPFFAAGQASVLYPLSILFYLMPLDAAYGWFTALQLAIAGINTYLFCRLLGIQAAGSLFSAIVFMFSGFLIVSVVFTMFMAAVVWLPLILAIIERIISKQETKGNQSFRPVPYVMAGSVAFGLVILAGHPELIFYTYMVAALYSLLRLTVAARRLATHAIDPATISGAPATTANSHWSLQIIKLAAWLVTMALIGVGLGAIQLIPLVELLPHNFRDGSASFQQVLEWAWPSRHVISFILPDVFGNPSHHWWFDIWQREWVPVTLNALGEPIDSIFWGIKNYVEGGSYLGIVTWLLAAIAVFTTFGSQVATSQSVNLASNRSVAGRYLVPAGFFSGLALLSLLFAFGTPLYAILFYGIPGWSQLHSPFRWVFPFTLSMAILGGMGLDLLRGLAVENRAAALRLFGIKVSTIVSYFCVAAILAGSGAISIVLLSILLPGVFIEAAQRIVDGTDLIQMAFNDGRMFWSYQSTNLVRFGVAALLSGLLVWRLGRTRLSDVGPITNGAATHQLPPSVAPPPTFQPALGSYRLSILGGLIVLLVLVDLYLAHGRFNPATSIDLSPHNLTGQPPVVAYMEKQYGRHADNNEPLELWRFTTFDMPGEKTFNANVGMYYGWHDVRGYDSIIPRQYTQLMEQIAPQGELLFNRIASLYSDVSAYEILDNPLLNFLNVRFIFTQHYIPNPGWEEIYRDETIGVYENSAVLPRAFIVPEARVVPSASQALVESDLSQVVFIEETPVADAALVRASPELAEAQISHYAANGLFVDLNLSDRGWLVLSDAYFPGWKAFLRPFGTEEHEEVELPIYRANGAFRTVYIPGDGQWTVRFVYSPMSFKLGLYVSFLTLMSGLLLLLWWAWGRYYRPLNVGQVHTVAKNSLVPMGLSLSNKAIDFAFAMLYARILGPEGTGKYYFVVAIYGFFEILSRYGLGTLVTRDVAANKDLASRYLTNVTVLRTYLWIVVLPMIAAVIFGYQLLGDSQLMQQGIGDEEVLALVFLTAAMLFANWSDGPSSLFYAFEKMEYTAGFANAAALFKVALGALVLLVGWGIVGLAIVSLVVNFLQLFILYSMVRSVLFKPRWVWDFELQKRMMQTSGPLMINHLLATIFWRIDIWILRPLAGPASVGFYSLSIKYLDGLNIIPSVFTMAVFPLMSRLARRDDEVDEGKNGEASLLRSYTISVRLLLMVSLPIALTVAVLAEPLIVLVGGSRFVNVTETVQFFGREYSYLGGADLALRVIIWSIPIGFVNSVTQYILIAVNQQRYLTKAFVIGVLFNTVGNLIVIPIFGYIGAAVVTILSEFSLLFPFYYCVKRHVGTVPWLNICVTPILSIIVAGASIYWLRDWGAGTVLSFICGWLIYFVLLVGAGAFRGDDMAVVGRALPLGAMKRLVFSQAG